MSPDYYEGINWTTLTDEEGRLLCRRLRRDLIETVSVTGGHLASNLGVVELTVALHRVFDTASDRIVFDVGHQCYCHKMLTGRADLMGTLRKFGGLSGFPKPRESIHDAFVAGHASNSVSVALGMARARTIQGEHYQVAALIGDGALTGGLANEGLSNAGQSGEHLVVIINDNGMSIQRNVGGMARLLEQHHLRPRYLALKRRYKETSEHIPGGRRVYRATARMKQMLKGAMLPSSMFEDLGFSYLGPVDGHDLAELSRILRWARDMEGPVVVHVRTRKGKGYPPAEREPHLFHGVSPFDVRTGKPLCPPKRDFSQVFGETLLELARENSALCAVSAAMVPGTGLSDFALRFPERTFDVGIAEGHAAAMCGGMAKQGAVPVFAVYSTFLQRACDMLFHDVALDGLHVVFGVDRAGLVGADGETHQGVFDLALLSAVPGMIVLAPASFAELSAMLRWAVEECRAPVAVRYPRGGEESYRGACPVEPVTLLREGTDITLITHGILTGPVLQAAAGLEERGISAQVVKLNRVFPQESAPVRRWAAQTGRVLVIEEVAAQGCAGQALAADFAQHGLALKAFQLLNCGSQFIPHGSVEQLRELLGLTPAQIAAAAENIVKHREGQSWQ